MAAVGSGYESANAGSQFFCLLFARSPHVSVIVMKRLCVLGG